MFHDHVGVHPQRDRRVRVAEASCHDMDGSAREEERRRVNVTQVV